MKANCVATRNIFTRIGSYIALLGLCLCGSVAAIAGSPYAGFYSGTYTVTSGTSGHGIFAAFVDAGGTVALVFDDTQTANGGGFFENIPVSSNGTINYTDSTGVLNASISGGILAGTVVGSGNSGAVNIAAIARSATGSYQGSAGYYAGTVINSDSTTSAIRVILAPDGSFYGGVDDNSGNGDDGFTGTMSGNTFSFISSGGTIVNGTLDTTAYLFNANYVGSGGIGTFTLNRIDTVTGVTTPWPDATVLANGWRNSSWFGKFNVNSYPWIYHQQHGWLYVFGTDPTSIWLYSPGMGFLWTGSGVYSWLWSDTQQTWLYYSVGSSNPRFFYNWNQQKWTKVSP